MKNILKLGLILIAVASSSSYADIKELTLITLESGEVLAPTEQIESITEDSLLLLDGRIINEVEINNVEVTDPHGYSEIIGKGGFKIIKTNAARIKAGGDATGGG